jgi:hypothetical protein
VPDVLRRKWEGAEGRAVRGCWGMGGVRDTRGIENRRRSCESGERTIIWQSPVALRCCRRRYHLRTTLG